MPISVDESPKTPVRTGFYGIIKGTEYRKAPGEIGVSRRLAPQIGAVMRTKSTPQTITCEYCGSAFEAIQRPSRIRRFCSPACASYWQTERLASMDPKERFWAKVRVTGPDDCWEWAAGRSKHGYGRVDFHYPGKTSRIASRVAWEMTHGPIPDGLHVLHECDNPPCCNPAHLFLGTHLDNVRDMHRKGRARIYQFPNGDDHNKAKLTWADIREIRRTCKPWDKQRGAHVLARKYGVKPEAIRRIVRGETWKNDPEDAV